MIDWAVGIGIATVFTTASLALPALIAARCIVIRRGSAPLHRGAPERNLVMCAALIGAAGALAWSDGCAAASGWGASETAAMLVAFVAPVPLAAVPWVAGEIFSGASLRPCASFTAAAAVASATNWLCYAVLWAGRPREPLSGSIILIQVPVMMASALLAARTYLAVRGETVQELPPEAVELERAASDYSSSMSENRSLRGASSGFF
jgi:hypothetical protein